jgi:hypothetical protein
MILLLLFIASSIANNFDQALINIQEADKVNANTSNLIDRLNIILERAEECKECIDDINKELIEISNEAIILKDNTIKAREYNYIIAYIIAIIGSFITTVIATISYDKLRVINDNIFRKMRVRAKE